MSASARIHLQVSSASPDLLAELLRFPPGRPRAMRLRALAELGLRIEQRLAGAAAGAVAATPAPVAMPAGPVAERAPAPHDLERLVAESDPNDLIGGLLDSF